MPIKSRKKSTGKRAQKKTWNIGKIILFSGVILCVILVLAYVIFSRSSILGRKITAGFNQGQQGENGSTDEFLPPEYRATLNKAKLQLESTDNKDIVRVVIEKTIGTGDGNITHTYEWTLNGQPAGDGSNSMSGFKRGDKVAVKITPLKDDKTGQSQILSMDIANTTPKIIEQKESPFDGKTFMTQIMASDLDGDALSYELLKGPQGMTIDSKSGMVNWPVKDSDAGDHAVKVKVSDGHGGETVYEFTVTLPKRSP